MSSTSPQAKASLEELEDGRPRFRGCSRIQDYEFISKLGEGTFGEVSKARSKKTGQVVALKKILMHNEKDGFPITALREIKLLKQLDHVNILKLEEMAVERTKDARKKPSMFMVTPYMDHDLSGLLENPAVHFSEPQIKCYLKQLLEGCAYLHENKILHRDMKAANLLINNRGILQIADFGLARPYDDEPPRPGHGGGEATREYTTLVVTRWYRPPELLLQLRKYTTAIDMWGVGCVFGEMFKGKPILAGNSDLNQAHLIFDLVGSPTDENMPGWRDLPGCEGVKEFSSRPPTLDKQFKDQSSLTISLLSEFLKLDWRKRINAMDALKHPYLHAQPLPALPHQLPSFEESHELDRRKFRDQKSKPPPAPAGGSVGVGPQGEWGVHGRPMPLESRGGSRAPGGSRYQNGNDRRPPPPPPPMQNGRYMPDRSMPRVPQDMPHDPNYRQPPHYEAPQFSGDQPPPSRNRDDAYSRLPPRPPPQAGDPYRHDQPPALPPYRDDNRDPPSRNLIPQLAPDQDQQAAVDTYIPSYSKADPNARPPSNVLRNERRDWGRDENRPPRRNDYRRDGGPPMDYGQPQSRYDGDRRRERGMSGGPPGGGYDRRRSRSPRERPHQHRGDDDRYRR